MRLFIEPTESLLFRTGHPFNAGENNFAMSLFPPTPETMQGALRAMLAVQWEKATRGQPRQAESLFLEPSVIKLIGQGSAYGRFRITEFTLGRRNEQTRQVERLFPAPSHIIKARMQKNREDPIEEIIPLLPEPPSQGIISNQPKEIQLLAPDLKGKKMVNKSEPLKGWLTAHGLQLALSKEGLPREMEKEERERYIIPEHKICKREMRMGIRMNNRAKTTEDRYLYQVQMIRMQQHYGFVVDIEFGETAYGESELPQTEKWETPQELVALREGWMTLGGEQRAAHFTVLHPDEMDAEPGISRTGKGNLLYFATPAYFQGGWRPKTANLLPGGLIAASIERYQGIGGWQLEQKSARGASKSTRRCVPAGGVYYFDHEISVAQPLTEYGWQIGYGITYTGVYK